MPNSLEEESGCSMLKSRLGARRPLYANTRKQQVSTMFLWDKTGQIAVAGESFRLHLQSSCAYAQTTNIQRSEQQSRTR